MDTAGTRAFRPALIVVDLQNDFCPADPEDSTSKPGALAVPGGRDILDKVNDLLERPFVFKVATQDWHPEDHVSFAQSHDGLPEFSTYINRNPNNPNEFEETTAWPVHCRPGTYGAELIRGLKEELVHHFIRKGLDKRVEMYSAFYDNFKTEDSGLRAVLGAKNITDVYVVGLAEDFCVKATALHAAEAGFKTYVVKDATRPVDVGRYLQKEGNSPDESPWRKEMKNAKIEIVDMAHFDSIEGLRK